MTYKKFKPALFLVILNFLFTQVSAAPNFSQYINESLYFENLSDETDLSYAPDDEVTFIVEVSGDPIFAKNQASLYSNDADSAEKRQEYTEGMLSFQSEIMDTISDTLDYEIRKGYTYTALFNGFSITAKYSEMETLKSIPGVENVYISELHEPVRPYLESSPQQISASYLHENIGYSGEGQVVAVIDSEFDAAHNFFASEIANPAYTKEDIENIVSKNSLNAATSAQQLYKSPKIPFAYDYGCGDGDTFDNTPSIIHGTHVAGIIGGKNGLMPDGETVFSGIAPECQLVLMKISTKSGSISDAAVLSALNDAALLGVSSINMSFGSKYTSSAISVLYAENLDNLKNKGVFISVSAGNESRGFYDAVPKAENIDYSASGVPASYDSVFSVASANNAQILANMGKLTLNDSSWVKAYPTFSTSTFFKDFAGSTYEYVCCGYGRDTDLGGDDLTGKIALVERGECSFSEKADNVKLAGAVGMIIWNDGDEYIPTNNLSLPTALVTKTDGQILFNSSDKHITVSPLSIMSVTSSSGGQISSFSSWGTSDNLDLKPEITAPGGNIYSSVPDNKYTTMSGTSMASPHIAGAMALINQYYETAPFSDEYNKLENADKVNLFSNLIMSSADVIKENEIPSSPRVQGAGLINLKNATKTPVVLVGSEDKTKINLGDFLQNSFTLSFTAKNLSDNDVTFDSLSLDVTTDDYTISDGTYLVGGTKKLTFIENQDGSVTIPAKSEQEISVTVTLDETELAENSKIFKNGFFIDGFVYLNTSDENAVNLNIPFTGFYGNWDNVPIFDTTMYDDGRSSLYQSGNSKATGTFLFSNYSDGYMPIGVNIFDSSVNSDFIAISPNGDGYYDGLLLNIQTYRTYNPTLIICNSMGAEIDGVKYNQFSKFYIYQPDYFEDKMSDLADGSYTLKVRGTYPGSSVINDSFTLPFVIDTENPKISSAAINESSDAITVSASDNHGVQGIGIYYPDSDGEIVGKVVPFSDSVQTQATAEFEIPSGVSYSDINIEVYDYALNIEQADILKFAYDLRPTLIEAYNGSTAAFLTYEIENASENNISAVPILSFYDENMQLIKISTQDSIDFPGSDSANYTFTITQDLTSAKYARLMLWDSLSGMKPLSYPQ